MRNNYHFFARETYFPLEEKPLPEKALRTCRLRVERDLGAGLDTSSDLTDLTVGVGKYILTAFQFSGTIWLCLKILRYKTNSKMISSGQFILIPSKSMVSDLDVLFMFCRWFHMVSTCSWLLFQSAKELEACGAGW